MSSPSTPTEPTAADRPSVDRRRLVVACRSLRPELEQLRGENEDAVEIRYLPQQLHRSPDRLGRAAAKLLERVDTAIAEVVLAYGWCSGGIGGLLAPSQGLWIPRVHDCIALLLGSRQAYQEAFDRRPGTYYLTAGWLDEQKDPIGTLEHDYVPRVGREDAEWALRTELEHYTHIVLIDTGVTPLSRLRPRAEDNARFLNKRYEEVAGSSSLLRRILFGPQDAADFVYVPPGQPVRQEEFIG